jgi:hypothetical protein
MYAPLASRKIKTRSMMARPGMGQSRTLKVQIEINKRKDRRFGTYAVLT